jgi:hypothetical protein
MMYLQVREQQVKMQQIKRRIPDRDKGDPYGVAQVGDRLSRRQFCDWLNIEFEIVEEFVANFFVSEVGDIHHPPVIFLSILENFLEFFCPVPSVCSILAHSIPHP